jgi:NAD(P)-dependent dehydrogenase (short-subunit alcohol dehydrogenase family)
MRPDEAERAATKRLVWVMPIIRGLLAQPSDSEDDPYRRVIISRPPGGLLRFTVLPGTPAALHADVPETLTGINEIQDHLRPMFQNHLAQHGSLPSVVFLARLGVVQVETSTVPGLPLENKVALVTGAAGAIGAGICRGLLNQGAHVAATDVSREALEDLVNELKDHPTGRVIGVRMDVTDKESVTEAFDEIIRTWGGVDIVVVNAGIAAVGSLMEMDLEVFRKLERVNVEGSLLTMAEAGRCFLRQGTGGDIILVSTKNVFAPGAEFGAYSSTKTASHQLARIASLEMAPLGVRVNMVAPDAVFSEGRRKSGLWAEVGPARMRARGLDEKGLEEFYRNRNLLKARVTATHVANAVLFFATRQTPTTGATIPVDGGLPDATPR